MQNLNALQMLHFYFIDEKDSCTTTKLQIQGNDP